MGKTLCMKFVLKQLYTGAPLYNVEDFGTHNFVETYTCAHLVNSNYFPKNHHTIVYRRY